MKVLLEDDVVEDGEVTDLVKLDRETLSSKDTMPDGGQPVTSGYARSDHNTSSGCSIHAAARARVPVEDCDDDRDDDRWTDQNSTDVEGLTNSLKGVSIQETASPDIERRFSQLSVKDEQTCDKNDERPCVKYQSQSSTITVDPPDPPSLPHEDDEARDKEEGVQDLIDRGPMAGKPTSFQQNDDTSRIGNKMCGSHNLDRFQSPQIRYEQGQGGCSLLPGFLQHQQQMGFYQPQPVNSVTAYTTSKRGMDDEGENPYIKYTRPISENGPELNNLSGLPKQPQASFSQVLPMHHCGGQMVDNSNMSGFLSPTELLYRPFSSQLSQSDYDSFLAQLELPNQLQQSGETNAQQENMVQQPMLQTNKMPAVTDKAGKEYDAGYTSESSPHSHHLSSPGSSPKSTFSPMRPPSNMSGDSGIASPYNEDAAGGGVAVLSPADSSQNHNWVPDDYLTTQYISNTAGPASNMSVTSPYSQHDECSMFSPGNGLDGNEELLLDALAVISEDLKMSAKSRKNRGLCQSGLGMGQPAFPMAAQQEQHYPYSQGSGSLQASSQPMSIPQSAVLQASAQPMSIPQPTMLQASSQPVAIPQSALLQNGKYSSPQTVLNHLQRNCLPAGGTAAPIMPPPVSSMPSHPSHAGNHGNMTLPCQGAQSKVPLQRPEKLPIAPLPKPVNLQQQPAVTSVPVFVVPSTSVTASVTSQPLLVMGSNLTQTPVILVVKSSQPAPAPPQKRKERLIRPRIDQPVPTPPPPPPSSLSQFTVKSEPLGPKMEGVPATASNSVTQTKCVTGNSGCLPQQSQPQQLTSAPQKRGQGRSVQQIKMLNVARRLVAGMTTDDLQYQDLEGDTYLHVSVCKTDQNMVQALLERLEREMLKDMVNMHNCTQQTPLYLAVSLNSPEMVELLIQFDADVNVFAQHTHADGRTVQTISPLHCIASKGAGYLPTLQALLLAPNITVDAVNSDGHTPLHCAILEHGKPGAEGGVVNNLPIIQLLLRHGANPNAQGMKNGKTPLMYALESRDVLLVETLVALIDPAHLMTFLRTRAFDETTCLKIVENALRTMDEASRQRLQSCLKIKGRRDS